MSGRRVEKRRGQFCDEPRKQRLLRSSCGGCIDQRLLLEKIQGGCSKRRDQEEAELRSAHLSNRKQI